MCCVSFSFRDTMEAGGRDAHWQPEEEDGWPQLLGEILMEFSPPLHSIFPCHTSWVLPVPSWNTVPSVYRWQMWQCSELWAIIQSDRHPGLWGEARNRAVTQTMELRWPPGVLERPWRTLEGGLANQLSSSCLPFLGGFFFISHLPSPG